MPATERARPAVRWILVVAAIAAITFVAAIAVQRNIFPFYSGDHDEPVYRFQAEMMRNGNITLPIEQNEFFRPWLSGPNDDHLVMAFQPGWPAVLMVADLLTGSMLVALGFAAALTVAAAFAFARQLLGSTARAALAAALVGLSPFTLVLSGTYLNYVFALALYLGFGVFLLRGLRNDSPMLLVLSGIVLGIAFLTRPYDSILFALPFAGYIIATRRDSLAAVPKIAGWVGLGAIPALAITFAYNIATSGNPLHFPVSVQSEGLSKFGWGVRSIAADTPELNFNVVEAFESMGTNLFAVPTWMLGTYLTLAVAAYGAFRLWKTTPAVCGLLLGLTFVWPVGYLAWWASSLTTNGALNGIGPHYYLPMLAPLAVLAAHGTGELVQHRRKLFLGGLAAAVVLTAIALPPKINEKHGVDDASRKYSREVRAGLRQRGGEPALLIQERRRSSYIMEPYPFLANPPDLDAEVLYARDRGARNIKLLEQTPDRRAFRIVRQLQPGRELNQLPVVVKPQSVVRGRELAVRATIINTSGKGTVTAYARFGKSVQRRLLSTNATKGERFEVTWILGPEGLRYTGPPARRMRPIKVRDTARRGVLVVGATFARSPSVKDPDGVERWYYAQVMSGLVELLIADEEWTRFGTPIHAWIPIAVDASLRVDTNPRG